MTPVSKRFLDGKSVNLKNYRFGNQIVSTSIASAIRHESDWNVDYSTYLFHACHVDQKYQAQVFAVENIHFWGLGKIFK